MRHVPTVFRISNTHKIDIRAIYTLSENSAVILWKTEMYWMAKDIECSQDVVLLKHPILPIYWAGCHVAP